MAKILNQLTGPLIVCIILLPLLVSPAREILEFLQSMIPFACRLTECCHPNDGTGHIAYERGADRLLIDLQDKVYGQPQIVKPIYKSIRSHLAQANPSRPLVMLFSGWTGTGKSLVARLIVDNLYKNGIKSKYVSYISSSYHFPSQLDNERDLNQQRKRLKDMVRDVVSRCERSLVILDEIDKLPAGIIDGLQPYFDFVHEVDGVRYSKAIFILISNTGAEALNTLSYRMFVEGRERKEISMRDVEDILVATSYNETGGLRHSSILRRHSVGVFVPFLPLERRHVELCIRNEVDKLQVVTDNMDQLVGQISVEIGFFPEDFALYSKSGCKGIYDKVIRYVGASLASQQHLDNTQIKERTDL